MSKKIMIVDDEEDIRVSVGQIFEVSGYEVIKAVDGNDCLNKLEHGNPDLVIVAARIPSGVFCLISALAFHEITTQIPHVVHVALPYGAEEPRIEHPPIKTYRFTGRAFTEGVESYNLDGVTVRTYSLEKTLADCFKFRKKIGLDTAVEALRLYRERKSIKVNDLMHYAAICRVEKIIRPYLEAIL